ncbi:MAG: hypothetical protein AABW64_00735 [Nanoarchaeota archaeon]
MADTIPTTNTIRKKSIEDLRELTENKKKKLSGRIGTFAKKKFNKK